MEQRRILSDVQETGLPKIVEKSPLIDPRKLRSCRSTPGLSRSASMDLRKQHRAASSTKPASHFLKPISESRQRQHHHHQQQQLQQQHAFALNRSQSAPHYHLRSPHYMTPPPPQYHLRSPQYRVNPKVKFGERPFPERMNYGIAGYNTSRPSSRSCSTVPETLTRQARSFSSIPEISPALRPRSFSASATRPRSISSIPESRSIQATRPATRAVIWRSWTRRFRDKMEHIRVRDTCSKLLSRFRG